MAIPTTIESLSTTAASNGPSGSDDLNTADDGLRQAYAFIRQVVSLGSNIASASTITPPSTGYAFNITGTTTITTIASTNSWDGRLILLIFAGALTLTHSSNLALPGSANITTAANDIAEFVQTASGAWRLVNYRTATGNDTVTGNLVVNGNTTLGNANTDTVTTNGNVAMNAPSSGTTLALTTVSAGNAATIAQGALSAFWGVDATPRMTLGTSTNHGWRLYVNNAIWGDVSTAGKLSLTPSSGYSLNLPIGGPASAGATGTQGDIAWDSSYIYVCTATNTWKRAALSTW